MAATSTQTTFVDGALTSANEGSEIGEGDGVGELVGDAVGVGDGDAVGVGVGDVAAFGCVVHAARTRTSRSNARIRLASHDLGSSAPIGYPVPGVLIVVQCVPPSNVRWIDPRTVA